MSRLGTAILDKGVDLLTPAERRVLDLALRGHCDKEIAAKLRIRPNTVQSHMQAIHHALGVHSRSELLALLLQPQTERGKTNKKPSS